MVIRNIANPRVVRSITKAEWEKMGKKFKQLFEVIDSTEKEIAKNEIKVSNTKDNKTKTKLSKVVIAPPTGEKKKINDGEENTQTKK